MSRLRLKHPKAGRVLRHLSLAWRSLVEKTFVKSANAVAKLDLSQELWAKPLKMTLFTWLSTMSPQNLLRLKAIAVMELLDEGEAMRSYLQRCLEDRHHLVYSRHLQMVELHVHLLYPNLWNSLSEEVRLFLEEIREAANASREDSHSDDDDLPATELVRQFDRQRFNSELHQEVSRMLSSMGLQHRNKLSAGPMVLDIHLAEMCIVEAAPAWQYYLRSSHLTALARRRQEMLQAMGFQVIVIPHFEWFQLESPDAQREFLRQRLPKEAPQEVVLSLLDRGPAQQGGGTQRRQRAPRRDVRRDVPELPPVDESIWKPMPVSEEELKAAMVVDEHSSVASVADAVWAGGAALFVHRWAQLAAVRKALNAAADAEEVGAVLPVQRFRWTMVDPVTGGVLGKARAEHPAGTEPVERFRVRRKRLRACARRLYVRVASNGRLGVDGGPRLGYVPVLYANHPFDLAFRANDVAALNVAWQFFVNGLDYSFLSRPLHPFFGVYFTLSPTEHFRLVDDWLKCWTPPSHSRVLDLGTGCGVISFMLRQHFSREEVSIVASDRCPNACFSVSAELWRQARSDESSGDLGIQVKHSELFEELEEEGPFDLIIFNPPWVPRALDHDAAENDVVFGNDYPPKLFEKLFEEVPKVLQPSGHLLVLFSNYALCRKLVEVSPMELGTRRWERGGRSSAAPGGGAEAKPFSTDTGGTGPLSGAGAAALAWRVLLWVVLIGLLLEAGYRAYDIRLWAIKDYGPIIHEFDPWFNYRATEYLAQHGWNKFFTWFDHQSWYPLGRPVATTIYPGMQITAVFLWQILQRWDSSWDLNQVCCYMPAWFGAATSFFTGLLTFDALGRDAGPMPSGAAVLGAAAAARCMAIVPAHLSRSVGGGFDNEAVAIGPMVATFAFWCRALRPGLSWVSYSFMAASWGGYIFALNMVGLHAGLLVFLGSAGNLYAATRTATGIGGLTASKRDFKKGCEPAAITFSSRGGQGFEVPMISWTPLRSLEQLGPLVLFVALQLHQVFRRLPLQRVKSWSFGAQVGAMAALALAILWPSGFFSPLSVRVSALFVKHTKTGNPLVDSVAEHQPGSADAYWNYLGGLCFTAPVGFLIVLLRVLLRPWRADADWFMLALGAVSYFFARKMKRLIIFMALPASTLTGCAVTFLADVALASAEFRLGRSEHRRGAWLDQPVPRLLRLAAVMGMCYLLKPQVEEFLHFCDHKARWSLSHPQIVTKAKDGTLIDDYRQAYGWLRQNTASDARIMAWWDYGYQIAGLANRTTLADGNTWNHEHIALLGLALSSPQGEAHKIARHLADYVLVWSGGGGKDDVGKSKHMARIANSVYRGHCNEDDCDQYGIFPDGKPSKMMEASLVYRLCGRGSLDERLFREVYVSASTSDPDPADPVVLDVSASSRRWAASAEAKRCDAYCPGSYSRGLQELFDPNATHQEALDYQAAYATRVQEQLKEKPLPNQEGLPPGSYLDSCRGCLISGTRLTCSHCRAPGSPSIASNLEYQKCPLPQINNIQGRLQCEPKPNAASIPRGGYQRSCKGCDMQGHLDVVVTVRPAAVTAVAAARSRGASPRFHRSPAELDNDNGRLTCRGVPNDLACPPGPYLKSCHWEHVRGQGCRSEAGHVSCALCRRADGRQVAAEAAAGRCRWPAQLENQDGELVCSGSLAGPYKQSCSKCSLAWTDPSGECAKSDGQRLVSSYEVSRCQSPAELHNREGKLTCQGVPNGRRLPPGPYLESCEGCHVFKETLHCSHCLNAEGLQLKSSLEADCC
ncbi:Dolichyl-diphosphooligosaccharide--protein glycosyltransferase subunit STT3 (Oligosaccharyl transferase subunit STT3) [Durusdinium trenchii]|uniref:dolichyl-diphosphooligosaccharide--protein glycotransferase n=1 Tax=Durusdinium trenchii TaxID=1381693 RepID=A0ABP0NNE6_9DINO